MKDIYFYEVFAEEKKVLEENLPKNISAGFSDKIISSEESIEPPAKIISIRTNSRIPASWNNKISAVLSRTTGTDHLAGYKIPCGYLPHYCSLSVAEQAIMFIFALARKLNLQISNFEKFNRSGITGREVKNMKLLIFGVGNIGYEIFKLAKNLGMEVSGIDIKERFSDVRYSTIENSLGDADVIICSMDLNKSNYNYFNYDFLKRAKKGSLFINISRGEISPLEDLLKLVNENHLNGVALDTFPEEKNLMVALQNNHSTKEVKIINALKKNPNVILTPHNAFNTEEATERKAKQTVEQLDSFLKNGKFIWDTNRKN